MRNIRLGFFALKDNNFISAVVNNNSFLDLLANYIEVIRIPIENRYEFRENFSKLLRTQSLDYLYVDSFNFLLESFLLRDKFGIDIPFILPLRSVFPWVRSYVFIIPLIREYDIIYSPSQYAKESFLRISYKFNVYVIPNSLDIKMIHNNIAGCDKDKNRKIITFMGRLVKDKGIEIILENMPKIIDKVKNAHLNIIGPLSSVGIKDYPKHPYVKSLEDKIKKLKLLSRVHFKGVQLGVNKYKMLAASDIFVTPTIAFGETFCIANLEALACGVPVITTNWGGVREIIKEGINGFLIDVDYKNYNSIRVDEKQMVSLIIDVLKDTKLNFRLREGALKISSSYDYRKIIPRFVNLLKNKEQKRFKSKWNIIKHKRVIDFRHLFNKDIFFFIYITNIFRKNTYLSLLKEHNTFSKKIKRYKKSQSNYGVISIIKKIEKEFFNYLLLKDN
ncbi:MAG: glycosyltransferase family 4 protein [Candidatus Omnitrophica bacterium]|nr:glycosyltransferase family 4 protein [Candidatus Omnitrophota bacterium]MCM8826700.1 glycosyltransferase family 4 protein [Candidatus Omnitrophota bacterium]